MAESLITPQGVNTKQIIILKANGMRESFDPEKLRASLLHAGASEEAAETVIVKVLPELHDEMTTSEIYRHAFSVLHHISKPIARSYSLRRAIMDLGPSGFPFEDFVAEVLKAKGFETATRQTVLGGCVAHEVDVVAWNAKKLIMCEAKFHNELGNKSDLKVVLYVKSRFDDLRENVFNYGGENRKMTEGWLITNTKFSSTAIHYAVCKNLTLIGWNYPEKGNLQDMVEECGLHPITCLNSLTSAEKKLFIEKNIVLCSSVRSDPSLVDSILGSKADKEKIIKEINELYEH